MEKLYGEVVRLLRILLWFLFVRFGGAAEIVICSMNHDRSLVSKKIYCPTVISHLFCPHYVGRVICHDLNVDLDQQSPIVARIN